MADLSIPEGEHDILTPRAVAVLRETGSSAYRQLVVRGSTPARATTLMAGIDASGIVSRPIRRPDDAAAGLAGLWLWLDGLDECHRIVQDIASPTGSLWHAIMHRRDGDFSNSKYWYHRCRGHHVLKQMGAAASSVASGHSPDALVRQTLDDGWNPDGFVDLVQAIQDKVADPRHDVAVRLQRLEWEALFDYTLREAVADDRGHLDDWDRRVLNQ